jgi:maltooligosyltrehalose trehalohydrolase
MQIGNSVPKQNISARQVDSSPKAGSTPLPGETVQWSFEYDATGLPSVSDLRLKGSFDPKTGAYDPTWNQGKSLPMRDDGQGGDRVAGDRVFTATVPIQWSKDNSYTWGVEGTLNDRPNQWMILQEHNPQFQTWQPEQRSYYAPVTNHRYGVHRGEQGEAKFCTWAPKMGEGKNAGYALNLDVFGADGKLESSIPMAKDPVRGDWSVTLPSYDSLKEKSYRYAARNEKGDILKTAAGAEVSYADPYSRFLQGQQRGVERIFVEPILGFETGWYDDSGSGGPNYADNPQWGRFSVDGYSDAQSVKMVLRDAEGKQLTKEQLLERLGEPKFKSIEEATDSEKRDVEVLTRWTMAKTKSIKDLVWLDGTSADGSIALKRLDSKTAGTHWSVAVNNFPELVGLNYEFQVEKDGKLVGDLNGDKVLQPEERKATPFNDPYSNAIAAKPGSARNSLVKESTFKPKFADAPRKETDFRKFVIYELHVGSFMGSKDNELRCTAEDFVKNLDYLETLGTNTIEMMPTAECAGQREWGYTPDHYFAGADAYGFTMDRKEALEHGLIAADDHPDQERVYINGTDAVRYAVDQAHKRGFNVIGDVVYNHASGRPDGDNPLWAIDGDERSAFKWFGQYESNTPWGAKLNYGEQGMKDFLANHSTEQLELMGFDGLRYDFAQVLHSTGSPAEQIEGMNALRQINRTMQAVNPKVYATAEDFTRNWLVAADFDQSQVQDGIEKKGMGFQSVWTDRFRLDTFGVAENRNSQFNMDSLMEALTGHVGVTGFDRAVTYAHSHDEVGNSGKWMQRGAAGSKEDSEVFKSQPRAVTRSVAALTLLGAGVPMLWQGEEFLANNDFKHGLTATWGHDTDWLQFPVNPAKLKEFQSLQAAGQAPSTSEDKALFEQFCKTPAADAEKMAERQGHFGCYQDLVRLRGSSPAFNADAKAERVYTHNGDKVMALKRSGGDDQFVIVSNFSDQQKNGYAVGLPDGRWQEVFNSDAEAYGGGNVGNAGAVVKGGQGVTLAAGGTVVFKKV